MREMTVKESINLYCPFHNKNNNKLKIVSVATDETEYVTRVYDDAER